MRSIRPLAYAEFPFRSSFEDQCKNAGSNNDGRYLVRDPQVCGSEDQEKAGNQVEVIFLKSSNKRLFGLYRFRAFTDRWLANPHPFTDPCDYPGLKGVRDSA